MTCPQSHYGKWGDQDVGSNMSTWGAQFLPQGPPEVGVPGMGDYSLEPESPEANDANDPWCSQLQ